MLKIKSNEKNSHSQFEVLFDECHFLSLQWKFFREKSSINVMLSGVERDLAFPLGVSLVSSLEEKKREMSA